MKLFKHWQQDLPASIVVFLVALPLCLGIALASGAPLLSGLIAGIVGGIIIGSISKSHLSVSGPAAGLVVIVLNAVDVLGSFEAFLAAVVLAGAIQLILGIVKAGIIGMYFPSSVIRGMLAAIGLILILKQVPHLVGFDSDAFGEMEFIQSDGQNTFTFLMESFSHITPGAALIGAISMLILILWELPVIKKIKVLGKIPAGVLVVIVAVALNAVFQSIGSGLTVQDIHLVKIPVFDSSSELSEIVTFPDFSIFANPQVYLSGITLAIVASLETLLSVEAIDKLDPRKRRTPKNRELVAQGIGNMISGFIGGLPITAVIVRSSANLDTGAASKRSAIYHGIFLLMAVGFFPQIMNMIPLAALAAILIVVGYKLTKPSVIKSQWQVGWNQFIPFAVTILAIMFTDLLIGIIIGMAVGVFFVLRANYQVPYHYYENDKPDSTSKEITIKLSEHVSFLNKASLQVTFDNLPENAHVILDGSNAHFIDFDALQVIKSFIESKDEKKVTYELKNLEIEQD